MRLFELGGRPARVFEVLVTSAELAEVSDAQAVLLDVAEDPAVLKPYLERLKLVVLRFPVFRDGRIFTQARRLREYFGFEGEIRAEGHVLPDQVTFLKRCGVDSVVLPKEAERGIWEAELARFPVVYQRSILPFLSVGAGMKGRE